MSNENLKLGAQHSSLSVFRQLKISVRTLLVLSVLLGLAYPLAITALSSLFFPARAHGSLIIRNGKAAGSELIGQPFTDPRYFWGRPSATSPAYNGALSSGSNLGPTNPDLIKAVKQRVAALHKADPGNRQLIPVDLVTASGSGLDPHISLAAAYYQAGRVARLNRLPMEKVLKLIRKNAQPRFLGLLGEPVVNVLELNFDLTDALRKR